MSLQDDQISAASSFDAGAAAFAATLGDGGPLSSVVRLTPRIPWFEGLATISAFDCGRWDTPADLISCLPNRQPEGSGWDGTVLSIDFDAPEPAWYVIVVAVHGPNTIAHLRGPWETVRQEMPAGTDQQFIGASWGGDHKLQCTVTFSGPWLGAVSAVQIFTRP